MLVKAREFPPGLNGTDCHLFRAGAIEVEAYVIDPPGGGADAAHRKV